MSNVSLTFGPSYNLTRRHRAVRHHGRGCDEHRVRRKPLRLLPRSCRRHCRWTPGSPSPSRRTRHSSLYAQPSLASGDYSDLQGVQRAAPAPEETCTDATVEPFASTVGANGLVTGYTVDAYKRARPRPSPSTTRASTPLAPRQRGLPLGVPARARRSTSCGRSRATTSSATLARSTSPAIAAPSSPPIRTTSSSLR